MTGFVVELMFVFALAVFLGIVFRYFGFPSMIGQVLAGLLVGSVGVLGFESVEYLRVLGTIGVTLLLFLVGLEMNWSETRKVAKLVLPLFAVQTLLILVMFFGLGYLVFGLDLFVSFLFAVSLSFCSTIVIVKVLSEKKELSSLSGKLSLGVLLLQDILAIVFMMLMSGSGSSFGLVVLFLVVYFGGHFLISNFMKKIIKSNEDVILLGLTWLAFSVYVSVGWLRLVPEIAGFIAGLSLADYWGRVQMVNKIKTIRDIFLTIFFVLLGLQIDFSTVNWSLVVLLGAVIVLGKFFVTLLSARLTGVNSNTAFGVAISMTQLSEFSLVVMTMGLATGVWDKSLVSTVSVSGLLTMVLSTWLILISTRVYRVLKALLPSLFQSRKQKITWENEVVWRNHIVLIGADRTGKSLLNYLKKVTNEILVVDFNPSVVEVMNKNGIRSVFADATDPEVLEIANMAEARMIISTVKDFNDSLFLLKLIKERGIKAPMIVDAETVEQAKELYANGADYVIYPHFVSGHHLNLVVRKYLKEKSSLTAYRDKQFEALTGVYD